MGTVEGPHSFRGGGRRRVRALRWGAREGCFSLLRRRRSGGGGELGSLSFKGWGNKCERLSPQERSTVGMAGIRTEGVAG